MTARRDAVVQAYTLLQTVGRLSAAEMALGNEIYDRRDPLLRGAPEVVRPRHHPCRRPPREDRCVLGAGHAPPGQVIALSKLVAKRRPVGAAVFVAAGAGLSVGSELQCEGARILAGPAAPMALLLPRLKLLDTSGRLADGRLRIQKCRNSGIRAVLEASGTEMGMQPTQKAGEPSMEEILASIRKIIAEIPTPRQSRPCHRHLPPRRQLAAPAARSVARQTCRTLCRHCRSIGSSPTCCASPSSFRLPPPGPSYRRQQCQCPPSGRYHRKPTLPDAAGSRRCRRRNAEAPAG